MNWKGPSPGLGRESQRRFLRVGEKWIPRALSFSILELRFIEIRKL